MENTETIRLVHKERVEKLLNLLSNYPEDVQTVFDLTLVALVIAELQGVEVESVYSAFSQQYPMARKYADKLDPDS